MVIEILTPKNKVKGYIDGIRYLDAKQRVKGNFAEGCYKQDHNRGYTSWIFSDSGPIEQFSNRWISDAKMTEPIICRTNKIYIYSIKKLKKLEKLVKDGSLPAEVFKKFVQKYLQNFQSLLGMQKDVKKLVKKWITDPVTVTDTVPELTDLPQFQDIVGVQYQFSNDKTQVLDNKQRPLLILKGSAAEIAQLDNKDLFGISVQFLKLLGLSTTTALSASSGSFDFSSIYGHLIGLAICCVFCGFMFNLLWTGTFSQSLVESVGFGTAYWQVFLSGGFWPGAGLGVLIYVLALMKLQP